MKTPRKPAGQAARDAVKAAAQARRAGRTDQAAQQGAEASAPGCELRDKEIGEESDDNEEDEGMNGPDEQLVPAQVMTPASDRVMLMYAVYRSVAVQQGPLGMLYWV